MAHGSLLELFVKLLLAMILGGIIGLERSLNNKAAGFRTMMLICVGAALFTMFSIRIGGPTDPARIAAQIVTGVGFIGAGGSDVATAQAHMRAEADKWSALIRARGLRFDE